MHVVHAMAGAAFGGAEAFFENLVLGLSRAGLEQMVVIHRDARRAPRRAGGISGATSVHSASVRSLG